MEIKIEVPTERIANLFCSAIEGGDPVTTAAKGGWCSGIYYHTKRATPPAGNWYVDDPSFYDSDKFQVAIVEVDDETTGHETTHIVRRPEIAKGLAVMATKFPRWFSQVIQDNVDAPCADVFLQCIVFGDEKYA